MRIIFHINYYQLIHKFQICVKCKTFANNSSAKIKLSKNQLHETGQPGGFLGRILVPIVRTGLSLMKSVLKPLAKSVLISLVLTAAASSTYAAIHKKMFG